MRKCAAEPVKRYAVTMLSPDEPDDDVSSHIVIHALESDRGDLFPELGVEMVVVTL